MEADPFERLVYELAHRQDAEVQRLTTPDGGADTVRPASDDNPAKVWQAKHYPDKINWAECVKSYKSSVERWEPVAIVFVFPRDFSEQLQKSFYSRLVTPGKKKGIKVTSWTLADLIRLLNAHDDLRVRFFGKSQEAPLSAVERAVQAGGRLETAPDLIERAMTMAGFTEQSDPKFTYTTMSGGASARAPNWDELPFMTLVVGDQKTRVEVATWPREGVEVQGPTFSFTDDEAGEKARLEAVEALAEGKEAIVRNGAQVQVDAPKLFADMEPFSSGSGGQMLLAPGEPIPLQMEIESPLGDQTYELEIRPVPFAPGAVASFAGYAGKALVVVSIRLLEEPVVQANVTVRGVLTHSPDENLQTLTTLLAFNSHTNLSLGSDHLFPAAREISGSFAGQGGNDALTPEQLEELEHRKRLFENLVLIQRETGQQITIPDEYTWEDVAAAETAADILRKRTGTITIGELTAEIENPTEIPGLPDKLVGGEARRPVSLEVFGQEIELGDAVYPIPKMKITEVAHHGIDANSPARVVLEVDGDPQAEFRLADD
jgi:hypothetical protein